jgi:hypothetical protein
VGHQIESTKPENRRCPSRQRIKPAHLVIARARLCDIADWQGNIHRTVWRRLSIPEMPADPTDYATCFEVPPYRVDQIIGQEPRRSHAVAYIVKTDKSAWRLRSKKAYRHHAEHLLTKECAQ